MASKYVKDKIKGEFESVGERLGDRVGQVVSPNAGTKGGEIGKKLGKSICGQLERASNALEKEDVTKEEQLGVGGKIGTGLGVIGRRLLEKRYGSSCGDMIDSADIATQGRIIGTKTEKMMKRAVKAGFRQAVKVTESWRKNKD
ncbi:MAG: hypothetical protein JRD47_08505 [Deltaproteobacteria bacterium]|nr:hypothetical protein [Deltaproteobacteria bacterium]MBW2601945.1 hypothetical protein [Deltaproteobacteria bacterium]